MKKVNFNLNSQKNGGKIVGFNYSRNLNEIAGSWTAEIAGGTFKAGDNISFDGVMTNGIISNAYKDNQGLWHIEGYDAGIKLMRTTPVASLLPKGNANQVINNLASFCNVQLNMSASGLSDFNVRSVVTGTTCAEAILELAMLSGLIAYIDNNGKLNITAPNGLTPHFLTVIDDTGSSIDLDGYATQVSVVVNRRKKKDNEAESSGHVTYTGRTPSSSPTEKTDSGLFSYVDAEGKSVSGSYSITKLDPFNVIESSDTSITRDGITVRTQENHNYDYKSKTIWRGNQEYVLFAFCERNYTLTKTTEGDYIKSNGGTTHFKEITTEVMERDFSMGNMPWIPSDWTNQLWFVSKETKTRSTVREGGLTPLSNMPTYSPPFDSKITREFSRHDLGRSVLCSETEITYECRQVGNIAPVLQDGKPLPFSDTNAYLAIQSHSTPQWVKVEKSRTYFDNYNDEGECEVSAKSEFDDDGAKWFVQNSLTSTGNNTLDQYQEDYAKFSQKSNGLEVNVGNSAISNSTWQFVELAGRTKNDPQDNSEPDWYENGRYVPSLICPHYSDKRCTISDISAVGNFEGSSCPYRKHGWRDCVRAIAKLEEIKREDNPLLAAPIVGIAGINSDTPAAGYKREIYIDDLIDDEKAQNIANTIAANILKVKSTKGIRKSVTIPYEPSYLPNGTIISVEHDWANLQTTVTYLTSGTIPDFMIPSSVAGIASIISDRDAGRRTKPMSGTITNINNKNKTVTVLIGGINYTCDTKLVNLGTGDSVLVSFTSGNSLRGQIIERL